MVNKYFNNEELILIMGNTKFQTPDNLNKFIGIISILFLVLIFMGLIILIALSGISLISYLQLIDLAEIIVFSYVAYGVFIKKENLNIWGLVIFVIVSFIFLIFFLWGFIQGQTTGEIL